MRQHAELFEKPQEKTVRHRHYLHHYGWIIFGLLCACMGFFGLWERTREAADRNATSDILWRGARQFLDSTLQQELDTVKNRHDSNPEGFRKDVLEQEERIEELTEKLQEVEQKRQEADEKSMEEYKKRQEADAAQQEADELKKKKQKR
jgi:pyruvate/2-oxoacid:ferredoxin oxidoreductase beta subunit